jgi:hypothetical protein
MTMADGEGDVARLTVSFGLRGFRYRSFGNRAIRPDPEAAPPPQAIPAAMPQPVEPAPPVRREPEPVESVPPPIMAPPAPVPAVAETAPVVVAPARPAGGFSLLRQALGDAPAIPAATPPSALPVPPAPVVPRPGGFALLPAAQAAALASH